MCSEFDWLWCGIVILNDNKNGRVGRTFTEEIARFFVELSNIAINDDIG